MHPEAPLGTVIVAILSHTPGYVWAILAALVLLGSLQLRRQRMSRMRLLIAPVAMGALSLWSATTAFGARPAIALAWLLGMAAAWLANRALRWPREVGIDGDAFVVAGSPLPLALMLAIFALRYTVAVSLVFHPVWRADPLFAVPMALLYGALSGMFTARAVRILTSGPRARRVAARDDVATA
jgi:uncharacterized integral membrane protein